MLTTIGATAATGFVVRADEKLTAFLELESAIRANRPSVWLTSMASERPNTLFIYRLFWNQWLLL
jgi:hypothetical protein